jgi:hypothetical protein
MKLFFFVALLFVAVYFFNRAYKNTKDIVVNRIEINTSNKKSKMSNSTFCTYLICTLKIFQFPLMSYIAN